MSIGARADDDELVRACAASNVAVWWTDLFEAVLVCIRMDAIEL